MKSKENLLAISQVAQVCSCSRATILRLEAEGFLTPAYRDEVTGYRYYDSRNVYRILKVLGLQDMGLTRRELLQNPEGPDGVEADLQKLEEKMVQLRRQIRKLRAAQDPSRSMKVRRIEMETRVLYVRPDITLGGWEDFFRATSDILCEAARLGHAMTRHSSACLLAWEPERLLSEEGELLRCFSPALRLARGVQGENVVIFPPSSALMLSFHGDPEARMRQAIELLSTTLRRLGGSPTGPLILLSIRGPQTGENIPREQYVTELAIPANLPSRT